MSRPFYRAGLALLALLAATACHTYTPVQTAPIGQTVRVHVPVANALAGPNQAPQTVSVEGVVVATGDTLALATTSRQEYGAFREVVQYDTIRLGADQPTLLEVREFSTKKSVLLGAVIAVGATIGGIAAFNAGEDGGDPPPVNPGEPGAAIVITPSIVSALLGLLGR